MDVSYQLSRIHTINSIVSCILLESWSIKKSGVVGLVGGECGGGVTYFHEQRPGQRSPRRRRPATAPRPRRSQGRREANHSSSAEFQASETHAYQSESGTRPQ
ncbi:hypothetical protein JYU34_007335 [Plutella xylostella]|uniref:Uncharacterized protein n=1 Tax=Plutella xylostella TaxID=51655 RepID=A0ABQ7QQ57_PLUXY|nr:hypothetical protein JYU34_007335 [Plutella xylostella]